MKDKNNFKKQSAITFIEIMIVIVIMAAIAALAGPALFNQLGGAKVKQAFIQMQSIKQTLDSYNLDNNSFPTTDQGLKALITKPELGKIPEFWNGPYLTGNDIPKDPWNNDYSYTSSGSSYEFSSLGADGAAGGTGNDKDIVCNINSCN